MATVISPADRKAIYEALQTGQKGSDLARKYGVSPSAISKIKSTYVPTEGGASKTVATDAAPTTSAPAKKSSKKAVATDAPTSNTPVQMQTIFVSSSRLNNKRFDLPVGSTMGDLLKAAGEDSAVKGVLNGAKNLKELQNLTDALPFTDGQPLYMYLVPLKTNGGSN